MAHFPFKADHDKCILQLRRGGGGEMCLCVSVCVYQYIYTYIYNHLMMKGMNAASPSGEAEPSMGEG